MNQIAGTWERQSVNCCIASNNRGGWSTSSLSYGSDYMAKLRMGFNSLKKLPKPGRPCEEVRPGLRGMEYEKHVIFYREKPYGVLISRVLHHAMKHVGQKFPE
jgi:hypothetical protein